MMTKQMIVTIAAASAAVAFSGCGKNNQVVKGLEFKSETVDSSLYAGFDATLNLGQVQLPYAKLPVVDPKNPSKEYGYIETSPSALSLRVNVTDVTGAQLGDGSTLPNGIPIPITLPAGVKPVGLPVFGSKARVYLAIGQQNIMAGVALTLKEDTGSSALGFPVNIFFPFTIAQNVQGSGGVFTGTAFGLGVFAVKSGTTGITPVVVSAAEFDSRASVAPKAARLAPEVFAPKTQMPSESRYNKVTKALSRVRHVTID